MAQLNPPPRYFRVLIGLIAAVQWLIAAAVMWYPPPLFESIFRIPIPIFRWLMLGAAVLISGAAMWMHPLLYRIVVRIRQHRASIWLVPLIAIPALPLLLSQEWIGFTLIGMQIALAAGLVYAVDDHADEHHTRLIRVFGSAAICTGLALRLGYVFANYVWNDEGIYMSVAANMLEGGGVAARMFHLPAGTPIRPGIGYSAALYGLWARIVGIGVTQMRVLSYLAGTGAVIGVFGAARRWWNIQIALLTAGVFGLSQLVLHSTWARNDAIPMMMVALLLWLHVAAWQRDRLVLHGLVGLATALLLEGHLTNLVFLFSFSVYYAIEYLREALRRKSLIFAHPLWPYAAGFGIGMAVFVWLHVLSLPDPAMYVETALMASPSSGQPVLGRLNVYWQRVMTYLSLAPAEVVLIGASLIGAAMRGGKADRHWLQLALLTELGYLLLAPYPEIHYSISGAPIYLMGTGALFVQGFERETVPRWRARLALYGAAALILASHLTVYVIRQNRERVAEEADFAPTVAYIRENYLPETAIIAPSEWYAYLPEYRTFILGDTGDLLIAPTLAETEPEAYWADVLLRTWPAARIEREVPFYHPAVFDSYMAARGATRIDDYLWVVDDTEWVRIEPSDAPLQLVAYSRLPEALPAGDSLIIQTLWVTRDENIRFHHYAELFMSKVDGDIGISQDNQKLVSSTSNQGTSQWGVFEFHRTTQNLDLPNSLDIGEYEVVLRFYSHREWECNPQCVFFLGTLEVVP